METTNTIQPEPEEYVENALVGLIAAKVNGIPVEGTHDPAQAGETKYGEFTYINVKVGQSAQRLDVRGRSPIDFAIRITVHIARSEDPRGVIFRDTCRAVRAALASVTGDGCDGLNGEHVELHAFVLDSTDPDFSTAIEGGEFIKTYNASATARIY